MYKVQKRCSFYNVPMCGLSQLVYIMWEYACLQLQTQHLTQKNVFISIDL